MYTSLKTLACTLILFAAIAACVPDAQAQEAADEPIQGTITVSEDGNFEHLARITLEDARKAALAEVRGSTVAENELDEEDGYLVYEVEVTLDGQEIEVLVDAGNGSVLQIEKEDEDDDEDDDE